jgi:hypothetical protein
MDLRIQGKTFRAIADELGMPQSRVERRINEYIRENVGPLADELREIESRRLDDLTLRAYGVLTGSHPLVQNGRIVYHDDKPVQDTRPVLGAIDRLIRIQERRARLLGLDQPTQVSATVHEIGMDDIELAALIREAKARQAADEERLRTGEEVS